MDVPAGLLALFILSSTASDGLLAAESGPPVIKEGNVYSLPIPEDLTKEDVAQGGDDLKTRLHRYAMAALAQRGYAPPEGTDRSYDAVIIFLDRDGQAIRPDRDAAAERNSTTSTELSFTFNSPDYPWTPSEQATLSARLSDFYPEAKIVYGDPAFTISVNIRQDPNITTAGAYNLSLNEIILPGPLYNLGTLCHEMIHAFHDDHLVRMASYEEGMTRAAEIEVFNRLPQYVHDFDEAHSYSYDVFYEGLSRRVIGSRRGNLFSGYVGTLLRYQLCGYAWGKAYLENPSFFTAFNAALYATAATDPSVLFDEVALLRILTAVQPTVESLPFSSWYLRQGALNTHPPVGTFLYQRISDLVVYLLSRDANGTEVMKPNIPIQWTVYDFMESQLDSGIETTGPLGWIRIEPDLQGYLGRIRAHVTATVPEGVVSDESLAFRGDWAGVFGIVPDFNTGAVTVTPLDGQGSEATASVVNGAFSLPSLFGLRGRFRADYSGPEGQQRSRHFTKDASYYFLFLGTGADPCEGPDLHVSRADTEVTISWDPVGESAYDVVKGSLSVLRSSGGDFTQALDAITPVSEACIADNTSSSSVSDQMLPDSEFYLVRALACGMKGTFDSGAVTQIDQRDDEIEASVGACGGPFVPGIVFDSASASGDLFPTSGNLTVSYSHNVGAELGDALLLVFVNGKQGPGGAMANCRATSVTYAGAALMPAGVASAVDASDFKTVVEAWYLVGPAPGAGVVQMTFPGECTAVQSDAISLGNVDQFAPITGTTSSTITASQACTVATPIVSGAGGWAIDAFAYNRSLDATPQFAEQTERADYHSSVGSLESSTRPADASPSTLGWNVGSATCGRAVHLVVAIGPS